MTRHLFSYGIRLRQDNRMEVFPAAELSIRGRHGQGIRATFHIDSGATISVLPASDAKALGVAACEQDPSGLPTGADVGQRSVRIHDPVGRRSVRTGQCLYAKGLRTRLRANTPCE